MNRHTIKEVRRKSELERIRTTTYGPPPDNPVKQFRLLYELTLEELSSLIGISKQALIRTEQGTYDRIPPVILHYLVSLNGHNELELVSLYENYQLKSRARNRCYFGPDLAVDIYKEHPFRQLRSKINVSLSEVAKDLCLPQSTLQYFERKWKLQKSVPKGLINVLRSTGYTKQTVDQFEGDYEHWRARNV